MSSLSDVEPVSMVLNPRPTCDNPQCEWRPQFLDLEERWCRIWGRLESAEAMYCMYREEDERNEHQRVHGLLAREIAELRRERDRALILEQILRDVFDCQDLETLVAQYEHQEQSIWRRWSSDKSTDGDSEGWQDEEFNDLTCSCEYGQHA